MTVAERSDQERRIEELETQTAQMRGELDRVTMALALIGAVADSASTVKAATE